MQINSPYQAFAQKAGERPFAPFLHIPAHADSAAIEIAYGDMLGRVDRLRARYKTSGVRSGERVGLLLENTEHFFAHFLALNSLGISVVPINPDYRSGELNYLLEHAEAVFAVALEKYHDELRRAAGSLPIYDETLAALPENRPIPANFEPLPGTECVVLYTSGTTGKPKGCLLNNAYFIGIGQQYLELGGVCQVEPWQERLITPLPMFHVNALACSMMAMIMSGGCVVQLDRFHPRTWWSDVAKSGATIAHYLGVMPAILLSLPPQDDETNHRIKFAFGANCDPRHQLAFEKRFSIPLVEAWGMTETAGAGSIASCHEPRNPGTRCIGRPQSQLDVCLLDESGAQVKGEGQGELLVRAIGPDPMKGFFSGYLKDPVTTQRAWEGGWFHTGDIVRRGPDGQYCFVDRLKNVIRRAGENIAALEVEAVILDVPGVLQVAVIAYPDPVRDEEVFACVRVDADIEQDLAMAQAIQRYCLQQLAYYKAPGYVAFVDTLPTTSSNKVQKARLSDLVVGPLADGKSFDLRAYKKRGT